MEFTLDINRVTKSVENDVDFPFLGDTVFDALRDVSAYELMTTFEPGGVNVTVIGRAFPYLPIDNPSFTSSDLTFRARTDRMAEVLEPARTVGAELDVLLSHNGFSVDRKLAAEVPWIDAILIGLARDAFPEPVQTDTNFLIASGSHG